MPKMETDTLDQIDKWTTTIEETEYMVEMI